MSLTAQQRQDVARLNARLENLKSFSKLSKFQKELAKAGNIVVVAAQSLAPQSDGPHARYNTTKIRKSWRAPKGLGEVAAIYEPGNLRRSIQVLPRYSGRNWLLIGPRLHKGKTSGRFSGRRVDAYYAGMVHNGTVFQTAQPFMEDAAKSVGDLVVAQLRAGTLDIIVNLWEQRAA